MDPRGATPPANGDHGVGTRGVETRPGIGLIALSHGNPRETLRPHYCTTREPPLTAYDTPLPPPEVLDKTS
jgi:hypothetical protein